MGLLKLIPLSFPRRKRLGYRKVIQIGALPKIGIRFARKLTACVTLTVVASRCLKNSTMIRDRKKLFVPATALLWLLYIANASGQVPSTANQPQREIKIAVTAIDKNRKLVETLRTEDFRLKEAGVPQSITGLNRIKGNRLSVTILIDTSLSQEQTLGGLQFTAKNFVTSTVRAGRDQAAVATFAERFTVEQNLTDELNLLQEAIDRAQIHFPQGYVGGHIVVGRNAPPSSSTHVGSTGMWDSIAVTCEEVLSRSNRESSRAIILLTDGNDTSSKRKMDDAIKAAVKENVAIYSIGIGDPKFFGVNKEVLQNLSEATGGRAFFPKMVGQLNAIFTEIREALRNQYILSYSQIQNTKSFRKLRIEIVNPALKDVKLFYQEIVPNTQP